MGAWQDPWKRMRLVPNRQSVCARCMTLSGCDFAIACEAPYHEDALEDCQTRPARSRRFPRSFCMARTLRRNLLWPCCVLAACALNALPPATCQAGVAEEPVPSAPMDPGNASDKPASAIASEGAKAEDSLKEESVERLFERARPSLAVITVPGRDGRQQEIGRAHV